MAGYRDPQTDSLYLIDSSKNLFLLDADSNSPASLTWKSKRLS